MFSIRKPLSVWINFVYDALMETWISSSSINNILKLKIKILKPVSIRVRIMFCCFPCSKKHFLHALQNSTNFSAELFL